MLASIPKSTLFQQKALRLLVATCIAGALAGCGGDSGSDERSDAEVTREQKRLRDEQRRTDELRRRLEAAEARAQQGQRGDGEPEQRAERKAGYLLSANDARSFDRLSRRLGGSNGLAVSGLGRRQRTDVVGDLRSGPAWSTIKVPIAIAVRKRGGGGTQPTRAAITASDNAAAERLWASLGGGSAAGAAVEEVLAEAGDTATRVQTQRVRPEFTAFGQTEWSLEAQQRFMAGVSCLSSDAADVLDLMEQVIPAQRWGIGDLGLGAQLKGGWGPDPGGRYLVRQMGAVLLDGGKPLALSIASRPADGTLEGGTRAIGEIARWAVEHVATARLPSSPRC
jgi:hypothetical protein